MWAEREKKGEEGERVRKLVRMKQPGGLIVQRDFRRKQAKKG